MAEDGEAPKGAGKHDRGGGLREAGFGEAESLPTCFTPVRKAGGRALMWEPKSRSMFATNGSQTPTVPWDNGRVAGRGATEPAHRSAPVTDSYTLVWDHGFEVGGDLVSAGRTGPPNHVSRNTIAHGRPPTVRYARAPSSSLGGGPSPSMPGRPPVRDTGTWRSLGRRKGAGHADPAGSWRGA